MVADQGDASGPVGICGRAAADNRLFVDAAFWVLRSGARRHDLPERYGKSKSMYARFMRWAEAGVWDRLFDDLVADRKNRHLMLDSTIVRAHRQAAAAVKKGLRRPGLWGVAEEDQAPRSTC